MSGAFFFKINKHFSKIEVFGGEGELNGKGFRFKNSNGSQVDFLGKRNIGEIYLPRLYLLIINWKIQ